MIMKLYIILFFLILRSFIFAQTFSGVGLPIAQNSWNGTQDIIVPVAGLPTSMTVNVMQLIQANIRIQRNNGNISTSVAYKIISPNGTVIVLDPSGYFGPAVSHMNFKFRDPCSNGGCSNLTTVRDLTGFTLAAPYNIGYHGPDVPCSFNNVLGEDPNGNWIVRFTETSSFEEPEIITVELIFGSLTNVDIATDTGNDDCLTPQVFCDKKPICYDNINHTGDNLTDPVVGGACAWNLSLDNTGWFYWVATSTSAVIDISGLSSNQQVIAIGDNGPGCIQSDYYVLDGGCPEDPVNNNTTYNNGDVNNIELNVSNLTIGETYYFIVDGEGGSSSSAYLTISGADNCITNLPVELVLFQGENTEKGNLLTWKTITELNNDYFLIEKKTSLNSWSVIGEMKAVGNSNEEINYRFIDSNPSEKTHYYRLKQVDFNGSVSYSKVISVNSDFEKLQIIPNPFQNSIVAMISGIKNDSLVTILDNSGRIMDGYNIIFDTDKITIFFDETFLSGAYFLKINNGNKTKVKRIIKK